MRPSVRVTLSCDSTTPFNSKVGGTPYLPKDQNYPTDPDGKPMAFLAQINFDDLTARTGYKIIYHANVPDDINAVQTNICVDEYALPFPTEDCYRMQFDEVMSQAITTFDCNFDEVVPNLAQFLNEKADQNSYDWELHEAYDTWTQADSHRVGSYPFFTQDDVRGWEHGEPLSIRTVISAGQ